MSCDLISYFFCQAEKVYLHRPSPIHRPHADDFLPRIAWLSQDRVLHQDDAVLIAFSAGVIYLLKAVTGLVCIPAANFRDINTAFHLALVPH